MKHFVLTGATGGIGRAIVAQILAGGDRATLLVYPGLTALPPEWAGNPALTVIPCDMADYAAYEPHDTADLFLHLAWAGTTGADRDNTAVQADNIRYTLDAVRLASRFGCTAFLGTGSQAEYGPVSAPLTPETPAFPTGGYGIAKLAAGQLSRLLAGQLGMRHVWVRILSVYGPGDADVTLIKYLIRTLHDGGEPELTPCGQIWDYLYVTDAARAILAALESGRDGAVYPIGSGEGRPLSDFVRDIRDVVAPGAPLGFGKKAYYPHQPMFLTADLTALCADTGFTPAVSFREGIRKICEAMYG